MWMGFRQSAAVEEERVHRLVRMCGEDGEQSKEDAAASLTCSVHGFIRLQLLQLLRVSQGFPWSARHSSHHTRLLLLLLLLSTPCNKSKSNLFPWNPHSALKAPVGSQPDPMDSN